METKSIDKWINQGKKNCKSYLFYQNKVLDLSQFMLQHPGGIKAIKNYVYKDITNIIFEVYPHNKITTLNKLFKYHVGFIPQQQATNAKPRAQKNSLIDKPKQKKKVCFTAQNQSMTASRGPMTGSRGPGNNSMNRSRGKQNMKQSTHKSNASKNTKQSKSKSKKKQYLTSIRVITQDEKKMNKEDKKSYLEYLQQNKEKIRQKQRSVSQKKRQRKQKPMNQSCSFVNNELDEEKPNFKVPVLCIKHMNRNV